MKPIPINRGPWLILAAAILWGTTGTAQAFAPMSVHPVTLGTIPVVIGGIAILAVAVIKGELQRQKHWLKGITILSVGCVATYQL